MSDIEPAIKSDDYEIRRELVKHLILGGITRDSIRHEATLDTYSSGGRADVVLLMPHNVWGLEIKSARDNLDRCSDQAATYRAAFECSAIVLDRKYYPAKESFGYRDRPPGWSEAFWYDPDASPRLQNQWLKEANILALLRGAKSRHVSPYALLSLLWAREACNVAAKAGINAGTRHRAIELAAPAASLNDLGRWVSAEMRRRPLNRWEQAFWKKFDVDEAVMLRQLEHA
jgi:hypothetical protein